MGGGGCLFRVTVWGDVGHVPGASEKIEKLRILPVVLKVLYRSPSIGDNQNSGQNSQKLNSPPRAACAPSLPRRLGNRAIYGASCLIQHVGRSARGPGVSHGRGLRVGPKKEIF